MTEDAHAASKISLVLADVDGTLVTAEKVLTPRAVAAVKALQTAGIAFAITSGRPPRGMAMLIGPLDLERAERDGAEQIRPADIVLVHTGWLDASSDRSVKSYVEDAPALSRAAGEWLRARGIKALGVDLPTPDPHGASDLPIHMNFLRPRSIGLTDQDYILIYENLVNIGRIPSRRFFFVGLPIPFRGASGSPVRAVALA